MLEEPAQSSVYVLDVRVDQLTQQQALDRIEQMVARRRASDNVLPCQQVVTVNTEFVMAAQHNSEFRNAINTAALVIPDGIGVVWATRYVGQPAPERVTGTDTLLALAQHCATSGSTPATARSAGPWARARASGSPIWLSRARARLRLDAAVRSAIAAQ